MLSLAAKRAVGLAAIVGGVLILVLGVTKPNPFSDQVSHWVEMDSVNGLGATGRDVRVAGVRVGQIGEVRRQADDAVIELKVDPDIAVKTDAQVDMRPHTLFEGSSFVDLFPGSPGAEELGEEEVIPIEQTTNYVTLGQALRILRPRIRERLADLAETGAKTLRGQGVEGIRRTLKAAPGTAAKAKLPLRRLQGSTRTELRGSIAGLADTVEAVARREGELIPLARRLDRTVAAVTIDDAAPLDDALVELPGALEQVRTTAPVLRRLVDRTERFAGEINPALPELTVALEEATPLLDRAVPVLRDARPILVDVRKVADRLAESAPTLGDLVDSLDPIAKQLGNSVLPVLLEPSRTGPPVYQQLRATFSAANGVFKLFQKPSQNPAGAGHLWHLGTYVGEDVAGGALDSVLPGGGLPGGGGVPIPLCAQVERVSPDAAQQLERTGGCRP